MKDTASNISNVLKTIFGSLLFFSMLTLLVLIATG